MLSWKKYSEPILLGGILILAAWLRFNRLDQAEFLWDQAEISKWALKMARGGEIAWVGPPSSTGLYSFLGTVWLMAIPYTLSLSPIVATGFIALLNVLAVLGCYLLTRHWFGRRAAWVAALLFTVAPWGVIYSRKIWQVELLAPFTLFYVFTGWLAFVQGRRWALLIHALALAWLVQIHFTALALVPLTLLWSLIFWRRLDWRLVLLSALLAALTFTPYLLYEAQHQWVSVRRFGEMMQQPATFDTQSLHVAWITTTGLDLHWLTGPDRYPEFAAAVPNWHWLFVLEGVLAGVAGLLALVLAVRQARRRLSDEIAAALMVTTWLVMPILFQIRHTVPVAPHYLTTIFPAPYILIGWLVARVSSALSSSSSESRSITRFTFDLSRFKPDVSRLAFHLPRFLLLLVLVIAFAQTFEILTLLRFVTTHDTLWGYDTPIDYDVRAASTAERLARELGGTEVILLSEGDEPRSYEMPATADVLFYESPHRAMDIRTALVLPAGPAVYWATYQMTPGEALLASFTPEVVQDRIPLREGKRAYRFYRWHGGLPATLEMQRLDHPPMWTNGAQLVGYQVDGELRPGSTLRWTLIWRATRTPTEDVYYHWFNHLLDQDDQLQGQQDGPSLLPAYWRAGDTILNWFDIAIPSEAPIGDYTMRVGMYVYPSIENVPLKDGMGQPSKEWVEIGPIPVRP
jgi:hypothetical protein